jgi:hypothetical protein
MSRVDLDRAFFQQSQSSVRIVGGGEDIAVRSMTEQHWPIAASRDG